jgi:hypothetical protein
VWMGLRYLLARYLSCHKRSAYENCERETFRGKGNPHIDVFYMHWLRKCGLQKTSEWCSGQYCDMMPESWYSRARRPLLDSGYLKHVSVAMNMFLKIKPLPGDWHISWQRMKQNNQGQSTVWLGDLCLVCMELSSVQDFDSRESSRD